MVGTARSSTVDTIGVNVVGPGFRFAKGDATQFADHLYCLDLHTSRQKTIPVCMPPSAGNLPGCPPSTHPRRGQPPAQQQRHAPPGYAPSEETDRAARRPMHCRGRHTPPRNTGPGKASATRTRAGTRPRAAADWSGTATPTHTRHSPSSDASADASTRESTSRYRHRVNRGRRTTSGGLEPGPSSPSTHQPRKSGPVDRRGFEC